jgi:hypothetical protein
MKKKILGFILSLIIIAAFIQPPGLYAQQTLTISGQVLGEGGRGIDGVTIAFFDGETTQYESTADGGNYSHDLFPEWSGRVTPISICHSFTPEFVDIGSMTSDIVQNFTAVTYTYTISGIITDGLLNPIPGVLVSLSTGASVVSGPDGSYSFTLNCGWTGTLTPMKVGWSFSPPSFPFPEPFASNQIVNFVGTVSTMEYTISGQVTDEGGRTGMDGVTITFYDGNTLHTELTSGGGYYSYSVPAFWVGTVTPDLDGYSFSPTFAAIGPVQANVSQNFVASASILTISGTVMDDATNPIPGVTILMSSGGTTSTDSNGMYSFPVAYGWSGTVSPSLAGWIFQPPQRSYSNVITNQVNEHYVGYRRNTRYTISGTVRQSDGTGIPGVSLDFSNEGGTVTTDADGFYSNTVLYGWSGTVTPSLTDYSFVPVTRTYTYVTSNLINQDYTEYAPGTGAPEIFLNPNKLVFGADTSGNSGGAQSVMIGNSGGGTLNWSIAADQAWLSYSPTSGTDSGLVSVFVDPSGLSAGTYAGTITVSSPDAVNSPQTVQVTLNVYESDSTSPPFGSFSTPVDGSTVRSSIPVTGWALDDVGVEHVKIYREDNGSLAYIGDAVFVEGARPDVELLYPDYPMNNRAGWGYMMLTYFLPNGGNGTYTLHAIATDVEGNEATLGTKTITCDNANAVKPFGALDTPPQGGTASGTGFINWGWVLTPQPNTIPLDGSTINVLVDGVNLGHPTYNLYREDIAALFPGYNNSSGAVGYFYLDTTAYENGVHTISWTATDNAGNTDGIGSRFFKIENPGAGTPESKALSVVQHQPCFTYEDIRGLPGEHQGPIMINKGYGKESPAQEVFPGKSGISVIEMKETGRMEIRVSEQSRVIAGYMVVGDQLRSLPPGSTLNTGTGTFCWQAGAGFVGMYRLVFIVKDQTGEIKRKDIRMKISVK